MRSFFNPYNPVMEFLSKIFDLIILNVLFILGCIPLVTIGTSISALSHITLKIVKGEDPYIWSGFWKSFRQNFKQGTLIWGIFLLIFMFLKTDFSIIRLRPLPFFAIIRIFLWIICTITLSMFLYIFPIISHFVCTTKQAFKNALFMTFGYFPYTILLLIIPVFILFICSISQKIFASIIVICCICGCSFLSLLYSVILNHIFKKYDS